MKESRIVADVTKIRGLETAIAESGAKIEVLNTKIATLEATIRTERENAAERQNVDGNRLAEFDTIAKLHKPWPFWLQPAEHILTDLFNNPIEPKPIPEWAESGASSINDEVRQMCRMGFIYRELYLGSFAFE